MEPEDHSVRVKGKRQVSGVPGKVKEVSLELRQGRHQKELGGPSTTWLCKDYLGRGEEGSAGDGKPGWL